MFSARSTDGHVFWQEPGVCCDNPYRAIDPKAIQVDGNKWKMFNHFHVGRYAPEKTLDQSTIVSATSVDGGVTFTLDDELPGLTGMVLSVKRFPDGFRMYYGTRITLGMEIRSAFSADGEHWEEEEGVRLGRGASPTVVETQDGRYRMYYGMRGTDPA